MTGIKPVQARPSRLILFTALIFATLQTVAGGGALAASRKPPLVSHRKVLAAKPAKKSIAAATRAAGGTSVFAREAAMSSQKLVSRWNPFIAEASKRMGIPGDWIRAVLMEESGGRTMLAENTPIKSGMGAIGLMQLMPETWREMQMIYKLGADPNDPHDNIFAGAAYLRTLYWEYGYPGMFAAYNDGPGMIEAHRRLRQLLPRETGNYVLDIASILRTGARGRVRYPIPQLTPQIPVEDDEPEQVATPARPQYVDDNDDDYYREQAPS